MQWLGGLRRRLRLANDLANELFLPLRVGVAIRRKSLRQFMLQCCVPNNLLGMTAEVIAEKNRSPRICWSSDMNVMGTPLTERRHALDEEHPVRAGVVGPKHVAEALDRLDQPRPLRLVGDDQHDVDDWLSRETGDGRAAEMLQTELDRAAKSRADPAGLDFEQRGPLRIVFNKVNAVLISVAPTLSVMSHALQRFCLLPDGRMADVTRDPNCKSCASAGNSGMDRKAPHATLGR